MRTKVLIVVFLCFSITLYGQKVYEFKYGPSGESEKYSGKVESVLSALVSDGSTVKWNSFPNRKAKFIDVNKGKVEMCFTFRGELNRHALVIKPKAGQLKVSGGLLVPQNQILVKNNNDGTACIKFDLIPEFDAKLVISFNFAIIDLENDSNNLTGDGTLPATGAVNRTIKIKTPNSLLPPPPEDDPTADKDLKNWESTIKSVDNAEDPKEKIKLLNEYIDNFPKSAKIGEAEDLIENLKKQLPPDEESDCEEANEKWVRLRDEKKNETNVNKYKSFKKFADDNADCDEAKDAAEQQYMLIENEAYQKAKKDLNEGVCESAESYVRNFTFQKEEIEKEIGKKCKDNPPPPPPNTELEDYNLAIDRDYLILYEKYLKNHKNKNAERTQKVKDRIREIKAKDEKVYAEQKIIWNDTDKSCPERIAATDKYLNDAHCTKYERSVKKKKKEIIDLPECAGVLLVTVDEKNDEQGTVKLLIKNGAPNSEEPFYNVKITRRGKNVMEELLPEWEKFGKEYKLDLDYLEGGDYKIEVTDSKNTRSTPINLKLKNPLFDFKIVGEKGAEQLRIKGGEPPFMLAYSLGKASKKYTTLKDRASAQSILTGSLFSDKGAYALELFDHNDTQADSKETFTVGRAERNLAKLLLIIGIPFVVLGLILTLAGEKINLALHEKFGVPIFIKGSQQQDMLSKCLNELDPALIRKYIKRYFNEKDYQDLEKSFFAKFYNEKDAEKKLASGKAYLDLFVRRNLAENYDRVLSEVKKLEKSSDVKFTESTIVDLPTPKETSSGIVFNDKSKIKIGSVNKNVVDYDSTLDLAAVATNTEQYYPINLDEFWADNIVSKLFISKSAAAGISKFILPKVYEKFEEGKEDIAEVGGFLFGKFRHDKINGTFKMSIEKFIQFETVRSGVYEIEFGPDAWKQFHKAEEENPDLIPVGWFHTHPGHGLFLSSKDMEIQTRAFNKPYQVAMIVDTLSEKLITAFFTRKRSNEKENRVSELVKKEWTQWTDVEEWLRGKKLIG